MIHDKETQTINRGRRPILKQEPNPKQTNINNLTVYRKRVILKFS
jgi:hypothetical protein